VQVLDGEGVANHTGLESCVAHREVCGEALTEVRTGRVLSHESTSTTGRRRCPKCGRQHGQMRQASICRSCVVVDLWHVRKPSAREPGDLRVGHWSVVRVGKTSES
jgi:hypothetical protein